jgi:two-component system, NtrC family, sensor histidine kinase HydH
MKKHLASIGLSILIFALLSGVNVIIFRGMTAKNRLESRNDGEHTLNLLFSSLRDHEDFGKAIEAIQELKRKVLSIGLYAADGTSIFSWGDSPASYPSDGDQNSRPEGPDRIYIDNPRRDSIIMVFRSPKNRPPQPPPRGSDDRARERKEHAFFFDTLSKADTTYLEVVQTQFWQRERIQSVLFPLIEAAIAAMIAFVRFLIIRNSEYRTRIEEQKSLVVLGTAASTLAHEIKNPLMAIRLQASIIEKGFPEGTKREIGIITSEVERLAMLANHVNDYLRDPSGFPARVDPGEIAREVGMRLCGRSLVRETAAARFCILMDPERFRSVLENLVQNALESGTDGDEVAVEIQKAGGSIQIDVLDRGRGIEAENKKRAFDPFFTTKSKGTGIGLAICERFVHAAGGTISLENRSGGGVRTRIELPGVEA